MVTCCPLWVINVEFSNLWTVANINNSIDLTLSSFSRITGLFCFYLLMIFYWKIYLMCVKKKDIKGHYHVIF